MTDREIMQQALTVLKAWDAVAWRTLDTIEGLETALAQPEQDKLLVDLIQDQRAEIDRLRHALAQPEQSKYSDIVSDGGLDPRNKFDAQPEQEPVAWRNAAIRLGEDLYSVGPNGYYDMTAKQWLDWALSVVNIAQPEQKSISTNEHLCAMLRQVHDVLACTALPMKREWVGLTGREIELVLLMSGYTAENFARAIEAKLKEKNT